MRIQNGIELRMRFFIEWGMWCLTVMKIMSQCKNLKSYFMLKTKEEFRCLNDDKTKTFDGNFLNS